MKDEIIKNDKGKPKLSLVPTQIIRDIAKVREYGVEKYHNSDNWKKVELQRYIDAFFRHWLAFIDDNNSIDEESGIEHYKHCACNMAFICELMKINESNQEITIPIMHIPKTAYSALEDIPEEDLKRMIEHENFKDLSNGLFIAFDDK